MMLPEQFTCHDLDLTIRTDNPADQMGEWSDCWPRLEALTTEQLLLRKLPVSEALIFITWSGSNPKGKALDGLQ